MGQLQVLPTGVGEPRLVPNKDLYCHTAKWLDSRHLVVSAHETGQGVRLYHVDSVTGEFRALSPEGVDPSEFRLVRAARAVSAMGADQDHWLYPIDGGDPMPLPHLDRSDRVVLWMTGENAVLLFRINEMPAHIHKLNLDTGERSIWRSLTPPDPTGIYRIGRVSTSADGSAYGYNYYMQLVDLHVVSGLK